MYKGFVVIPLFISFFCLKSSEINLRKRKNDQEESTQNKSLRKQVIKVQTNSESFSVPDSVLQASKTLSDILQLNYTLSNLNTTSSSTFDEISLDLKDSPLNANALNQINRMLENKDVVPTDSDSAITLLRTINFLNINKESLRGRLDYNYHLISTDIVECDDMTCFKCLQPSQTTINKDGTIFYYDKNNKIYKKVDVLDLKKSHFESDSEKYHSYTMHSYNINEALTIFKDYVLLFRPEYLEIVNKNNGKRYFHFNTDFSSSNKRYTLLKIIENKDQVELISKTLSLTLKLNPDNEPYIDKIETQNYYPSLITQFDGTITFLINNELEIIDKNGQRDIISLDIKKIMDEKDSQFEDIEDTLLCMPEKLVQINKNSYLIVFDEKILKITLKNNQTIKVIDSIKIIFEQEDYSKLAGTYYDSDCDSDYDEEQDHIDFSDLSFNTNVHRLDDNNILLHIDESGDIDHGFMSEDSYYIYNLVDDSIEEIKNPINGEITYIKNIDSETLLIFSKIYKNCSYQPQIINLPYTIENNKFKFCEEKMEIIQSSRNLSFPLTPKESTCFYVYKGDPVLDSSTQLITVPFTKHGIEYLKKVKNETSS